MKQTVMSKIRVAAAVALAAVACAGSVWADEFTVIPYCEYTVGPNGGNLSGEQYYSLYSITEADLVSVMNVNSDELSGDDAAVLTKVSDWFKKSYWENKTNFVQKAKKWNYGFVPKSDPPRFHAETNLTVVAADKTAATKFVCTNVVEWIVSFYNNGNINDLRVIHVKSACTSAAFTSGNTGVTFGSWNTDGTEAKSLAKWRTITAPANTEIVSISNPTNSAVVYPPADGKYALDNGLMVKVTLVSAKDGYYFADGSTECTVVCKVPDGWANMPAYMLPTVSRAGELPLDWGDGVTYVPGDYVVVDLATGEVTTKANVSEVAFQEFVTNDDYKKTKMVFRKIPAGRFMMDCNSTTAGFEVTIDKDYYLAIYECTAAQWEMATAGAITTTTDNTKPRRIRTWNETKGTAGSIVAKMRQRLWKQGYDVDLPNEAQWSRAAHAGTTSNWYWGNTHSDYATYESLNDSTNAKRGFFATVVGSHKPNGWGFYDMLGNMREWCLDWYAASIASGQQPGGPATGTDRLLCGCSWGSGISASNYQNTMRLAGTSTVTSGYNGDYHIGFRLALTVRTEDDLDVTDGTTFVPGDYVVLDLEAKTAQQLRNVSATEAQAFAADEYKTKKMVFRKIPAGSFMKGATDDENMTYLTGTKTTIDHEYYIAIYECTIAQFEKMSNPQAASGDAHPKANITKVDLNAFVGQVAANYPGCTVALPSDNEWERAARAGTTTASFYGSAADLDYVWRKGTASAAQNVGGKSPNAWGLYDILGNVYEDVEETRRTRGGGYYADTVCTANTIVDLVDTAPHPVYGFRLKLTCNRVDVEKVKDADGNEVTVKVDDVWAKERGLTTEQVKSTEAALNGLTVWENYVLGLEPNDSLSKPVVSPVQTTDPEKLTLAVTGIDPHPESGMTVKYVLNTGADTGHYTVVVTNELPSFSVPLPESGVKYFKVHTLYYGK